MFKLTNISLVLFITAILNTLTFVATWQRRRSKGGYYFAFGMLSLTLWVLVSALDYAATSIPLKVFFAKFETLFYNSAIVLLFTYFFIYVGYENWVKKKWLRWLLWGIPIINILLAATNDWHYLYWSGFTRSTVGDNILIFHHGPAFGWVVATGYAFIFLMISGLAYRAFHSTGRVRRQVLVLIAAIFIPVLSNVLYLIEIPGLAGIDWTSIFFSLFGVVILFAIYGTRFLDIAPIARRSIVEGMNDPILVLDQQQHIVDFNTSALRLFGLTKRTIGEDVDSVLADYPEILPIALETENTSGVYKIEKNKTQIRYFDIHLTILRNQRENELAKILALRDVTARHQTQQQLTEQLKEIETLNKNLQAAQETVVEQARTLAKLEERERLGRDLHDSVNQSIHSVMLSAETLQALLGKGQVDKALHVAERIQSSGLQALKEIRLLLYEIASPLKSEKANFIELMEIRLNMVERRVGIRATIEVINQDRLHCSQERIENLYWLAIEALNNSLKHAKARQVIIRLNCTEELLIVDIEDDGIGFEPDQLKRGGLGMRSMHERADLLGGTLTIQSVPNKGTKIRFYTRIEE